MAVFMFYIGVFSILFTIAAIVTDVINYFW